MIKTLKEKIKTIDGAVKVRECAYVLSKYCHGITKECGGWDQKNPRSVPELLMLCVSELAEAMKGDKKDLMDNHLTHRKMIEVKLADAVISVLDMGGGLGLDVAGAIAEKLEYITERSDHKPENRANGGKKY
jgi:NTP pyrophosphatase (non-canonical NTP hydrolase)